MENAVQKVDRLYYETNDYDRVLAGLVRTGQRTLVEESVEARVQPVRAPLTVAAHFCTTKLAGLAAVWNGEQLCVIGTPLNFLWWPASARPARDACIASMECLLLPDTKAQLVHEVRAHRIQLLQVQHMVAELYPALRHWPSDHELRTRVNIPEVQLFPHVGGLHLGGCVMDDEHYTSGRFLELLGIENFL